jgi:hypothetical protein
VARDLTSGEGAFWSAEDADSEGEEGRFYVWTRAELREAAAEDADVAEALWGLTGRNILHVRRPLAEVAAMLGMPETEAAARVGRARECLLARRANRVRPLLDDKVLADWNGLMIAASAHAGWALGEPRFVEMAERAADVLWRTLWRNGTLLHRYRDGDAAIEGNLDDYAFLAWGAIELHQATQDPRCLERAVALVDAMLDRFSDGDRRGLFFSPAGRDDLIVRMREIGDGALPSGAAVAFYDLLRLARLTGRTDYEARAGVLADACSRQVAARPSGSAFFLVGLDIAIGPSQELVVVGDLDLAETRALLDVAREGFHPRLAVLHRQPGDGGRTTQIAPVVRDFGLVDGRSAAYLCRGFVCERPVTGPGELRGLMERAE